MRTMKLFDCHNHMHLGPNGIAPLLESVPRQMPAPPPPSPPIGSPASPHCEATAAASSFAGAAIMSTHPRDYAAVDTAVAQLREQSYRGVPCYGIHPWFLHEVLQYENDNGMGEDEEWLIELRQRLIDYPDAIVGEIGLDGARWRVEETNNSDTAEEASSNKKEESTDIWKRKRTLSCPMEHQKWAFEQQLLLATELQRPVSIHVVRAWGELFDSFEVVRNAMKERYTQEEIAARKNGEDANGQRIRRNKREMKRRLLLPPKIYFHAFSGKAGSIPSILAACEKGNLPRENVYFGFAPAIPNFSSAKTPPIMKQIGIRQLVLETDLEDSSSAWDDLTRGVEGLALALDMDVCDVADRTHENAERLYFEHSFGVSSVV